MVSLPTTCVLHCPDPETLHRFLLDEETDSDEIQAHVDCCPTCQQTLDWLVGRLPGPLGLLPEDDNDPPQLPEHEVIAPLRTGGMGVVWRVRDTRFQRTLALKVMKQSAAATPHLRRRFVAEARITSQLAHPYIVPVHSRGELADGRPYYTMKLVEGPTLADLLAERTSPDERRMEFLQHFSQLCQATAFAHERGVLHRDLKPANVMIETHGGVQLMDWGLGKVLDLHENGRSRMLGKDLNLEATSAGKVMGTLAYMPPEQARGEVSEIDRCSDVFGLGAILCEILTGAPPYRGTDGSVLLLLAQTANLTDARQRLQTCGADAALTALAERCLSAEKSRRPSDAGEVAEEVGRYLVQVEERLHTERTARAVEQIKVKEERKRHRIALSLTALLLGTIGLALLGALSWHRERTARWEQARAGLVEADNTLRVGNFNAAGIALKDVQRWLQGDPSSALDARLEQLMALLNLGRRLDQVRHKFATWSNGNYDCKTALDGYKDAFVGSELNPLEETVETIAERIRRSPLSRRIVAACDDWAWLAERERRRATDSAQAKEYRQRRDRLLEVARAVAGDSQLRDPAVWETADELKALAAELDLTSSAPELLVLVGKLLEMHNPEEAERFWEKCLAHHSGDFWLPVELAMLLMLRARDLPEGPTRTTLAWRASGHYRTALALRRDEGEFWVCLDLSESLRLAGDREGALDMCERAARANPKHEDVLAQFQRLGR